MSRNQKNVKHNKPTSNKFVYAALSKIQGHGLFARTDIPAGEDIVEYDGSRISAVEGEELTRGGNVYVFQLDRRTHIDGSVSWNLARYANHSCKPNCAYVKVSGRVWLRTLRLIAKGEEITYDYGYSFADYQDNPCRCGQPECAGYIVPERFRDKIRQTLILS